MKHLHRRQMAPTDLHARRLGGHQRHRNTDVFGAAQNAIGVRHLERQPQHRGHRPQGDVALVPIQADADEFATIHHLAAHHAGIHHGRGIRARFGAGEAKARYFAAIGQARQPVIALRGRAELHQQFARPQRIRHHDRDARRDRIGGNAPHHFGMRIGRKAQATVAARNDHAEKALRFQEVPHARGQVTPVPGDVPFVQHGA
ncbi:hypothetical protein D3C72_1079880 [compost metagenome]